MAQQSTPRPASDLFPESLRLSPKQTEVLNALQTFPQGARATDIAEAMGMHVNTARGHLDELVAKDAVSVSSAPAEGRGRPSLIFQVRVPDNRTIAEEYITLINIMASLLSDDQLTPEALEQARAIGRSWAKRMGATEQGWASIDEALDPLYQRLRDMGFDPQIAHGADPASADLALNSCPFVAADGTRPSPLVCAMHEGFLERNAAGASGSSGSGRDSEGRLHLELIPFAPGNQCTVRLTAPASA